MIAQIIALLMGFITRVIFTHTLSQGYVGINGLFTDILNLLSLTELGVGTAITYALYEPIASNDIKKQKIIMNVFRNLYRITACIVFILGISIIPFLNILMKNRPDVDHIVLIYMLYLMNSVISYLFVYKKTLIEAYQQSYITVLYHNGFIVLQDIIQIFVLLLTKNFILFLVVAILCTSIGNFCMSKTADHMFPFLKEKCTDRLNLRDRKEILGNIKAAFVRKLSYVVVANTDNLLISGFVGVISSGIYSNYFLLIGSIRQVVEQILNGAAASIGNFNKTESAEKTEEIYKMLFFISQWLFGFCAICLFELLNPFIEMVFGKHYLFAESIVFVLCLNFFLNGLRRPTAIFQESMGLFIYDQKKAVMEAIVNLVASILLVYKLGILGIFIGTFISTACVSLWYEPYIVYKHGFHKKCSKFFMMFLMNVLIVFITGGITYFISNFIQGGVFIVFLYRLLVCCIVPNLLFIAIYRHNSFFNTLKKTITKELNRKI